MATDGSSFSHCSWLWAELKSLDPERTAKLSYTKVSTEQLEPMVEKTKKAQ